ncbi:MAG: AMP-binding protein [Microgenomates group bacterium]
MTDSLRNRLLAAERDHAASPALWIEDQRWSYAELFDGARALGAQIDAEAPPGLPLGIFCQRDQTSLLGILAAALSGRPYLPLNPGFPPDRLAAIVGIGRPGAVLCSPETRDGAEMLLPTGLPLFGLEGVVARGTGPNAGLSDDPTLAAAGPTAYMMFTSGTTGTPKGVRVLESNLLAYLDGIAPIAAIGPGDRATHFFDLSFDLSVHDIFVTWTSGAELCVLPKSQSMAVADFARDRRLTHWFSVPSLAAFCERLGQLLPAALPDLRTVLFCGEALAVSVMRRFREAAPQARIWNIYGPTEATIAFTAYEVKQPDGLDGMAVVPIGLPIGQEKVRLDALEDPAQPGAAELCLGGHQVTPGYMNNPEQNATRFEESAGMRWYRTGDVVRLSEDHGILFLGRIDDQVKINGYRVELQEIDAVLRRAAETPEVAAVPWPVSASGHADQVVAFVVNSGVSPAEIRKRCRVQLPAYMVPRKVIVLDRFPLTASGKIDRKGLCGILDAGKG